MIRKKVGISVVVFTLIFGLATSSFAPKRAEAVVGIATGAVPVAVLGGATMAFSAVPLVGGVVLGALVGADAGQMAGALATTGLVFIVGLILLDGPQGPAVKFTAVDETQAVTLGLTEGERSAFNAQLDEINAVAESVGAGLVESGTPSAEVAKQLWLEFGSDLDKDALSAVARVSVEAFKR